MTAFVAIDDGKKVTLASSEWARAMRYIRRLETLVEDLLENDPNDLVADGGYTLLDAWRADARRRYERASDVHRKGHLTFTEACKHC